LQENDQTEGLQHHEYFKERRHGLSKGSTTLTVATDVDQTDGQPSGGKIGLSSDVLRIS